ncbi:hypothetical protein SM124_20650 [Bacillus sp. 31A1R]|uniref:Uncharacterized protein n=1 Tax=Robertmurraya mangrovi TaxID=3098077 RepID=A0ABU5J3Z2_9BACI|nr:hypothetical protein [Bacillus sp. 31A1R]MDZ5474117.1 hypothetical protein [Bacillus sp. 31A1R]
MQEKKPIWPYVYLILSVIFFLKFGLPFLMLVLFSLDNGLFSLLFYLGFGGVILYFWWKYFRKALAEIKGSKNNNQDLVVYEDEAIQEEIKSEQSKNQKSWIMIILIGLIAVTLGPGIIFLPILPLFLAAMSTDSGNTPGYVPLLILVVGYTIIGGIFYGIWRVFKSLRKSA